MLARLRTWAIRPPLNPSRHHLDAWLEKKARENVAPGSRILDIGAGDAPYARYFSNARYETADLAIYDKSYADLTYVCDVTALPVRNESYDIVICTQVLEHVRDPLSALTEISRVLKPGGQAWLSAPFFYEEHEIPYDFFRFTKYGWKHLATQARLSIMELEWLEGYYGTLSYQFFLAARFLPPRHLGLRVILLLTSRRFARRELSGQFIELGVNKNYRVVLQKPI